MLILGGAAATGAIAIQLGKAVGAYVTTTVAWLQDMRGFRSFGLRLQGSAFGIGDCMDKVRVWPDGCINT